MKILFRFWASLWVHLRVLKFRYKSLLQLWLMCKHRAGNRTPLVWKRELTGCSVCVCVQGSSGCLHINVALEPLATFQLILTPAPVLPTKSKHQFRCEKKIKSWYRNYAQIDQLKARTLGSPRPTSLPASHFLASHWNTKGESFGVIFIKPGNEIGRCQ